MKTSLRLLSSVSVAVFAFSAAAFEVSPNFALGLDFGGDKIFEATMTDGSTRSMTAGGVAVLTVGADITPFDDTPLHTRLALGFKAAGVKAENGKYDFFRWIFEASEHYRFSKVPVEAGIGTTVHFANKVNTEGILAPYATDIDPSVGFFMQGDYLFFAPEGGLAVNVKEVSVGVRYTLQKYTRKASNTEVSANAFGAHFRFSW